MTRVIGGSAGGRSLAVPPRGTRPTTEKVREALFSRLEHAFGLDGARVLDLYAGSGAVALEAASRGAKATAVESAGPAIATIRANAERLDLAIDAVRARVENYLAGPLPSEPFDIVFLDPPYALDPARFSEVLAALARDGWLAHDAIVVLELDRRSTPPATPSAWGAPRRKDYGETTLLYYDCAAGA